MSRNCIDPSICLSFFIMPKNEKSKFEKRMTMWQVDIFSQSIYFEESNYSIFYDQQILCDKKSIVKKTCQSVNIYNISTFKGENFSEIVIGFQILLDQQNIKGTIKFQFEFFLPKDLRIPILHIICDTEKKSTETIFIITTDRLEKNYLWLAWNTYYNLFDVYSISKSFIIEQPSISIFDGPFPFEDAESPIEKIAKLRKFINV